MFKKILQFQIVSIICQAFNIGYSVMIARLLTKLERGVLGENLLYVTIIFTVAGFGYNEYIVRAIKDNQPINIGRLIIISTLTSTLLLIGASFSGLITISITTTILLCILSFFYYYSTLNYQIYWAKGNDLFSYLMRIFSAILLPVLILLLFLIHSLNETSVLIAVYISFFIRAIIYFIKNKKEKLIVFSSDAKSNNFNKIWLNSAATIIIAFTFSADKIWISSIINSENFATYLIAISIYTPLVELLASASTVLIAKLNTSDNIFRKVVLLFSIYFFIFVIVGEFFVKIIPFVFGNKYQDAVAIASLFYPYFFLLVCFRILDYLLRVYKLNQSLISSGLLVLVMGCSLLGARMLSLNLTFQNLAILLTTSILIVVVYQFIMYANYGRKRN